MKLTDLDPRWYGCHECGTRLGFTFICPRHWDSRSDRLGCKIAGCAHHPNEPIWQMHGEDFATLTITPSINAHDHWHGFITEGRIVG